MNVLMMKTIAMNPDKNIYLSPSRKDFTWEKDIMVARCEQCAPTGTIGLECNCGIYGSPNIEALTEYESYSTSFNVLLNTYGRVDVWTAPDDIWACYIVRAWAAKVIGIVQDDRYPLLSNSLRSQAAVTAMDYFDVSAYSLKQAKQFVDVTWEMHLQIHPYAANKDDPWQRYSYHWKDMTIGTPWATIS
jgi:hypothetical protein